MDDREKDDWGDIIDEALGSPDATALLVPRELLIAVDSDLLARTSPADHATSSVMWFTLGMLFGIMVVAGYVAAVS